MNRMYKRLSVIATVLTILALVITGCTSQASNIGLAREDDNAIQNDFVVTQVGNYDSADTAVVISVDLDNGYVTFMNLMTGKQYTLSYDGTTYVEDKYEGPMAMSQIRAGDIVDITFLKTKKKLASVQLSPQSWVYENVSNYDLGGLNKTATIGPNTYSLPDQVVILSDGRRTELMEIVNKDVLRISGIDHTIYSIEVDKGHGYLRLSNDQALVGGWIEVGNVAIQQITENMLLAIPEGSYQVLLSNGNARCIKDVVIDRNREVVLDVGDLEIIQDKVGKLLLTVNPSTASVNIDGEAVDISKEIELPYGIHQIRLEAEGYQTMTKHIQVGSEYASLSFTLEEGENEEENSNSVSDNNSTDDIENAVTGNRVYVDAPQDVEVYLDGNYVGISPANFTKVTGDHTITLSKAGYQSKSYTIYLYDDGQDITYSFADLEADYDDTVSGNNITSRRSSTSSTGTKAGVYTVTIQAPQGTKVWWADGYKGIIGSSGEMDIKATIGSYRIDLQKAGYLSVKETIDVDGDITIPFELEKYKSPDTAHEHSYTEEITKEPTCTTTGIRTFTCSCGDTKTETISVKGHNYKEETTKAPTCTDPGVKTITCTNCKYVDTQEIPATGHHYSVETKDATCTEDGEKISTCEDCGDVQTEAISATGHHYNVEIKDATCTENGVKTSTCEDCGDIKTEAISATGHHYEGGVCTNCGEKDPNVPVEPGNPTTPIEPGDSDPPVEPEDTLTSASTNLMNIFSKIRF